MNTLLGRHVLPTLTREEADNLSTSTSATEVKIVVENLPRKKIIGPDGFSGAFYQTFQEEVMQILSIFF